MVVWFYPQQQIPEEYTKAEFSGCLDKTEQKKKKKRREGKKKKNLDWYNKLAHIDREQRKKTVEEQN